MSLVPETAGYLFAVAIGGVLIPLVNRRALHTIGMPQAGQPSDEYHMANPWTAAYVGIIERILYVASLQLQSAEFIGLWLGIKVAGGWARWSENRKIFQVFLMGNGLSVMYAAVGFKLITWVRACQAPELWAVPSALVTFTILLWAFLRFYGRPSSTV